MRAVKLLYGFAVLECAFRVHFDICRQAFQNNAVLSRKPDPEYQRQEVEHEAEKEAEATNPAF